VFDVCEVVLSPVTNELFTADQVYVVLDPVEEVSGTLVCDPLQIETGSIGNKTGTSLVWTIFVVTQFPTV
jgi:hypothetical protein